MTSAAIYGCSGHRLTEAEKTFFADVRPWGFILFRRNIDSPDQVRALTRELRDCIDNADAPILIDQEGGRVQRMGPPHWPKYPPAEAYLKAAEDPMAARELVRLGARLMAHDLKAVGINVDCLPVLDVPVPGAHDIIGDRAYARDPATVGGSSGVQIGAFSTPGLADREFAAIVGRYPQFTAGADKRVQEVTASNGSTVYRTTVTGLSSEQATGLCNAIKAAGGDCFIR